MVRPLGKAPRRGVTASGHPRNLPPPLIQLIATFLPVDSFFVYLRAFQSTHSLGDLRHFWSLVNTHHVTANDVWPELHLRSVDAANANKLYRMAQFVSMVHIHDNVYDLDWLWRVVPAGKAVALQSWPCDDQVTIPIHEWGDRLAKRWRVLQLSFTERDLSGGGGGDNLVALLPKLPWLRDLNLEELNDEFLDDALEFVCNSKLTSLAMGTFSNPVAITVERALLLTVWLKRERVESVTLSYCSFELDNHVATMHRFVVALARSSLKSLTLSNIAFGAILTGWGECPILANRVKLESSELTDHQAELLFAGLARGSTTNLHLDDMRLTCRGMFALGELIRIGKSLRTLTIEGTLMDLEGWDAVAKALSRSKNVQELYLLDTCMRDADVVLIANALVLAACVRVVHVIGNPIQFAGAVALVLCIGRRRQNLDELKLEGLAVTSDEVSLLKSMLDKMPSVKRCSVTANDVMRVSMQA
ncbi:hypothetical protein DYB32_002451 [Aphanomyces invadans]|uniref:F-box domain-containing protein n=1 Tax=Aphanomyces invadans TaxID=157072 RepID=A0A418B3A3_9STRA|nr:hypothetical protein DYB32_002451 [Aphanomyces invadans]